MKEFAGKIGRSTISLIKHTGSMWRIFIEALYWIFIAPFRGHPCKMKYVVAQMNLIGIGSVPIVALVNFFFGITLAMLTSYQLKQVGSQELMAGLVGVSFTRELGPFLAAIVVASRVGAAITAEIGTMAVSEEIDALETMALKPIRFLVAPRLIALLIMLPCLTVVANVVGMMGGYIIGRFNLHIDSSFYIKLTFDYLVFKDIWTGLIKSVAFAVMIALIGCYQGLTVRGGAAGVGISTTQSVVQSIIFIIIIDCLFNAWFYFI
ncbi:MAG: ABC transporter permease [bacterium]|nr:ABC transporter permease [bacterium]